MELEQRKDYVDYIKAIGIILVVMGHINFANSGIKSYIYSFHMPLFFFAAGLCFKKPIGRFKDTLNKKIVSLLVPFFLWGGSIRNILL